MGVLLQDLRYALRTLAKSPGFSAAAILILALGIGANAAIFSLVDAVVLKPLPGVARPKELVDLTGATVSYPWYRSVRESTRAFDGLAAWRQRELAFVSAGVAERAVGAVVSGNYFEVLGVRPSQGRVIVPADEESGDAVAVIAERFWRTRLGSDPAVVGKTIRLNGASFVVVGVAPGGFRGTSFGLAPDLWVPIGSWPRLATGRFDSLGLQKRGWSWLSLLGRRRAEVSIAQAQSEIDAATRQQHSAFPDDAPDDMRLVLRPTVTDAAGFGESGNPVGFLALLAAAVAAALAIACANLGNLLLTRAAARRREIAVRQALGASRFRLLRQLLTESAVLAFLGGGAGLLVAGWALSLAERLPLPAGASIATFAPALDPRAFAFAFLLSAATALAFGLLPALHASRNALGAALKNDDRAGSRPSPLRNALIVTQVSLCLALLVGAGLLGRSLQRALSTDLGFQPGGLVLASINPGLQRYDAARAETLLRELPRRLAASPGIRGASWMELVPLSGGQAVESFAVPGRPAPAGKPLEAEVNVLGGGFCRVMGIPLVSGREFDDAVDRPVSEPVIMVNEAMAKLYWPGRNAVGERLDIGGLRTIVGVTRDFRTGALGDAPVPQIYLPLVQRIPESGLGALTLVDARRRAGRRRGRRHLRRGASDRSVAARVGHPKLRVGAREPAPCAASRLRPPRTLRRSLARPRRGRHLRRRVVRGRAPHPGDRHPDGARGASGRRDVPRFLPKRQTDRGRARARPRPRRGGGAPLARVPLRGVAARSHDVRRRGASPRRVRGRRGLASGATRGAHRPHRGASERMMGQDLRASRLDPQAALRVDA